MPNTIGISPKVALPALLQLLAGLVLVAIGERELGLPLIVAATGVAGIGYSAPAGSIKPLDVGVPNDEALRVRGVDPADPDGIRGAS